MLWVDSPGEGRDLALRAENTRTLEPHSVGPRGLQVVWTHLSLGPSQGIQGSLPAPAPTTKALLRRAPRPAWPEGQGELGGGGLVAWRLHRVHPKRGPVSQRGPCFAPSPSAAHPWEWTLGVSQEGQDRREPLSWVFRTQAAGHLGLSVWAGPGQEPASCPCQSEWPLPGVCSY